MTFKYATLLSATKFRTRLGRSIITVIAASLVASIMLVAVFVITGLQTSITGISQTRLSAMNLAQETMFTRTTVGVKPGATSTTAVGAPSLDQYKSDIAKYNPQAVYEDVHFADEYTLTDPVISSPAGQPATTENISARTDALYTSSLDTSSTPAAVAGTVPGAIGTDVVLALEKITFSDTDTAAFKIGQTIAAENAWRGKVITLSKTDPTTNVVETIKVTIQGFLPVGGLFGGGQPPNSVMLPLSSAQTILKPFPDSTENNTTFYAAFANQTDLLSFVQNETTPRGTGTGLIHRVDVYANPFLQFQEIINQVRNVLKYLITGLLVAVALAMMTTLSKIISDSERETGVFRAIGARVTDILQIYIGYSVIISVLAMMLATAIGTGLAELISSRQSGNLTYELLSLSGSSNLTTHVSLFGINWLEVGGVFLAILVAALIGTLIPLINLLRRDPIKALRAE